MANIQLSLFGRMYPVLFHQGAEQILEPCLKKSQKPVFQCLQVADGQTQEWLEGRRLIQPGGCSIPSIGGHPNVERESTLSEILQDSVPGKYSLSPKACLGILRRAENKNRKLPDNLRIALEQKIAEQGGEIIGLDFAHADSVVRTFTDKAPTLVQNMGRGGGQTPCVMYEEKRNVIPLRDEVTRNKASNGLGVGEVGGPCPTLTTADVHSVFYEAYQHSGYRESKICGTITANQAKMVTGSTPLVVRTDRKTFELNQHGGYRESEVNGTLRKTGGDCGGGSETIVTEKYRGSENIHSRPESIKDILKRAVQKVTYVIRRLTPVECERLQGYPDNWTKYGADGAEIADTARYRAIGNSICVYCAERVYRGILDALEEEADNERME